MTRNATSHRLLILSCSRRKRPAKRPLPAVERYDGPAFQVLRKFIAECPGKARSLDVFILSGKYGLIAADRPIACYDTRLTPQQAESLRPKTLTEIERILARRKYKKFFLSVGQTYLRALAGYERLIPKRVVVTPAFGSSGRRQAALRDWLRDEPPRKLQVSRRGAACLRGVKITLTPEEVKSIACRALAAGKGRPDAYQSWSVSINGRRVAPKWLVSQLTGLPVRAFATDEARRVLAQLGIEAVRV
jgi:hypothetical protein